jgi:hypothetical protein
MKKFTISCDFGGQVSPFTIFIGKPEQGHHPLHFQADWLSKARGGMIPGEVMEAVSQLQELAEKNGVSLEELCVYALGSDDQQAELEAEAAEGIEVPEAEPNPEEETEEVHEKHETDDRHEHGVHESVKDMASEGGHIEEDTPDDFSDDEEDKGEDEGKDDGEDEEKK